MWIRLWWSACRAFWRVLGGESIGCRNRWGGIVRDTAQSHHCYIEQASSQPVPGPGFFSRRLSRWLSHTSSTHKYGNGLAAPITLSVGTDKCRGLSTESKVKSSRNLISPNPNPNYGKPEMAVCILVHGKPPIANPKVLCLSGTFGCDCLNTSTRNETVIDGTTT
jgi:hypothetical protein